jgi:hypothetical protein
MNCSDRDNALFLHALGEDSFFIQIQTATHLRRCPTCQARYEDFLATSGLLAHHFPPMGITPPHKPVTPVQPWLIRGAIIALGAGALWISGQMLTRVVHRPVASQVIISPTDDGCRPGIASDKCH